MGDILWGEIMTIKELVSELSQYPDNLKVTFYSHGSCSTEDQEEVILVYLEGIYDEYDNKIEEVISLAGY